MQVILLEKIRNLGDVGMQVNIRPGYGRNYLIPQGKAIPATKENIAVFAAKRAALEIAAAEAFRLAEERAKSLSNLQLVIPMQVSEEGRLYGSVGLKEIINGLAELGHTVDKSEISLPEGPIHQIGEYDITLLLHPDVTVGIKLKVVPSEQLTIN